MPRKRRRELSALHCGRSDCIRVVVPGGRPSAVCATARGSRSRLRPLDVSGRRLRSRRDVLATPVTRTASKKIAVIDEDRGEKPVSCRSPDEANRLGKNDSLKGWIEAKWRCLRHASHYRPEEPKEDSGMPDSSHSGAEKTQKGA